MKVTTANKNLAVKHVFKNFPYVWPCTCPGDRSICPQLALILLEPIINFNVLEGKANVASDTVLLPI